MTRSRSWILLLSIVLLGWLAWRVLLTPHGTPSTWTHGGAVRSVAADGAGIVQDIRLDADGFDGVWIFVESDADAPRGSSRAPALPRDGQVLVALAQTSDGTLIPLERRAVPASAFGRGAVHLPFRAQRDSRGETYRLRLQHVGRSQGEPLRLRARRDDAHPVGRFEVDGREQWGDLMFKATARRATLPFWLDEILAPWPGWMRSRLAIAAALLVVGLLCVRAALAFVGRWQQASPRQFSLSAGRAALAVVGAVSVVGVAVVLWPTPRLQTLVLAEYLDRAAIETTRPSVHEAVAVQATAFGPRVQQAVVALPTTRLTWRVRVPKGAVLEGAAAARPDVWHAPGDGMNLAVTLEDAEGGTHRLAAFTLFPYMVGEHRRTFPFRISLDAWAGQVVSVTLATDPERWGNAVNDVPVWLEPQIVWPRGPQWGRGEVLGK